jgi:hypothetical protein
VQSQRADRADTDAALALLSAAAVRERAHEMLDLGLADKLPNFRVDLSRMDVTAAFVAHVIHENYPTLQVPLHARWRHFVFSGQDFWASIADEMQWPDAATRARAEFDLAIVSVLLDAGAGAQWHYRDPQTGLTVGRSEGLALASLRMFEAGFFSADPHNPLRVDAERLVVLNASELADGFQVSADNPMGGFEGRAALLSRLGRTLIDQSGVFATRDTARPGGLFDHLAQIGKGALAAPDILKEVLAGFGPIWPSRISLGGIALGDTWRHTAIKRADATNGLVPLHKLSQWLTYSLIEPMQRADAMVTDMDGLTGLAEYRNGGLFVDAGVLAARDAALATTALEVDAEAVVEWRALTVALLDRIAPLVKEKLGVAPDAMPLGSILEGGTWAAGRKIAKQKRPDGSPPLTIVSDGTVF